MPNYGLTPSGSGPYPDKNTIKSEDLLNKRMEKFKKSDTEDLPLFIRHGELEESLVSDRFKGIKSTYIRCLEHSVKVIQIEEYTEKVGVNKKLKPLKYKNSKDTHSTKR